MMDKAKNPVILSITHHRQNPLESTKIRILIYDVTGEGDVARLVLNTSEHQKRIVAPNP
jgi:hypothetical protein